MRPQFILNLHDELIVDNFAGGGGASTGIELALGRAPDHAINHDQFALGMHRINHPKTVHHCEDVFDIDPLKLTAGRRVGLGWFSPDCTHFSKAKGGKPLSKKIRGLALVILRWAAIRTRVLYMENVEEIQTWGPLLPNNRPDPAHKGRTWRAFLDALGAGVDPNHPDIPEMVELLRGTVTREQLIHGFGYHFEHREIRASNHGARTIRKRLFLIARCDGMPIVWPDLTHSQTGRHDDGRKAKKWRPVAECIDWDRPCPSIFLSKAEARVAKCKRPLAKATLRRVATGIGRYVIHAAEPFLVSLTHQGGDRIESVNEPIKTITGAHRGEKALVAPLLTEHANGTHQRNFPADEPLRTQMANVKGGHFALVAPVLARTAHGDVDKKGKRRGRGAHEVTEPLPSTLATQDIALVAPMLAREFGNSIGQPVNQPAPTIMPGGQGKTALLAASLAVNTTHHTGAPVSDPAPTITSGGHHALVAASLVKMRGDTETHPPGQTAADPLHTISAGGTHHAVSCAYLAQHNGGFNTTPGHPVTEPLSTVSAKGSQQQVVSASLAAYYGSEEDGQAVTEPLRTITNKPRFGLTVTEAAAPVMTEAHVAGARRVAKFLRDHGVEFEGEFATVGGLVIFDIGMRMLTPRELFRAQGFPEHYVIDRAWLVNPKTGEVIEQKLTKEQQIRMCGNSVCPDAAEAIVRANSSDLAVWTKKQRDHELQHC